MYFPDNVLFSYVQQNTQQIFKYLLEGNDIKNIITDNSNNTKLLSFKFSDNKKQMEYESGIVHFNTTNINENILKVEYVGENIVALHTSLKYLSYEVVFTIEINKEFINNFIHKKEINNAINEEYMLFLQLRVDVAYSLYANKILDLGGMPKRNCIDMYDILV